MGIITQFSRISHHTLTASGYTGSTFTVPAGEDFTDGTWDIFNLCKSEIGVDEFNNTAYIRIGSRINKIVFNSGDTNNYWASGTTGIASLKANNGTGLNATGNYALAQGNGTLASGQASHAQGNSTTASGLASHAQGESTLASGFASHAQGDGTTASGVASHAQGKNTIASGDSSHASGFGSTAAGLFSFVHGTGSTASGIGTIVLGNNIIASGTNTVYVPDLAIQQEKKIYIATGGTNPTFGLATLIAGNATVTTTNVSAKSIVIITAQKPNGVIGALYVSARTPGTSFDIQSTNALDTSLVGWVILEQF